MLKKTIMYTDYNDQQQSDDYYFHLTKSELLEMEWKEKGGMSAKFQAIIDSKDAEQIMKVVKDIILRSVGQKSEDGKRFVKTEEIRKEFEESEAFDVLFMELITDAEASVAFMNGIIPNVKPK